ncbi:tRNA (adenosine(37)-N6)-threonylcarbamoyltransferase complex transferase subunit TsaD [Buchnera aphidicola]|uniref:tRNA (adenosine(37)-N6)-threonylcarbamoyltransferase complex transferase subunit TsaD n=1 Tax=Buchnera aphidicola TaxID=9 RepID=UPI0030EF0FEE
MRILGIETSCDDTGVAIYDEIYGLVKNFLHNQKKNHNKYYGIVPELAARLHTKYVLKFLRKCLNYSVNTKNKIDAIAYTAGPGLVGSLLVGASIASSFAFSLNLPMILINHLEGHLLSSMIEHKNLKFPFLTLLISGKNTQLIYAKKLGDYIILGKTLDNSVGEVFDKVARGLNLNYPGGPEIYKISKFGKKNNYNFPKPLIYSKCFNFSFSGLKTSVLKTIYSESKSFQTKANIATDFQNSIIEILIKKCFSCLLQTGLNRLVITGGVSSNLKLRKKFIFFSKKFKKKIYFSSQKFCTDNGAMIAYAGYLKFINHCYHKNSYIFVNPKWNIEDSWVL